MRSPRNWPGLLLLLLSIWGSEITFCPGACAQSPEQVLPPTHLPPPSINQVEAQLRAMEDLNKKLSEQLDRTTSEHNKQINDLLEKYQDLSNRLNGTNAGEGQGDTDTDLAMTGANSPGTNGASPVPDYTEGQFAPFAAAPGYPNSNKLSPYRWPLSASFGPGFQLQSQDGWFRLRIHYESQIEGRVWGQESAAPPDSGVSGFYLPRQRFFFSGNITEWVEYELAINRGLNNLNLLNAFFNLHFADQFQVRVGRYLTPNQYDQYAISNYWMLTPERSLFTTNLGLNRQIGAMAWGYLFDERLDYAAGAFNGGRNSFENANDAVDFVGYLNARPFQESESLRFARFLNVGTSVAFGHQDEFPAPAAFRIGAGSPDSNIPGPATVPFLILNPDVIEQGNRLIGSVHLAYFLKGLSLIGEWQYGYGTYAAPDRGVTDRVPYTGYYVAAGYFLTGEEVEQRSRVKPLRPFLPLSKNESFGLGAWEAVARYCELRVGDEIFTGGFADPVLWSNSATTTELGMNWYWNDYMKVYMFWLHGEFAKPVETRPDHFQTSANMFWLRWQLYF